MLVDNVGDVTITNDGATILSLLEVTQPAVRKIRITEIPGSKADGGLGSDPGVTRDSAGQGGRRRYYLCCSACIRAVTESQRAGAE